MSKSEQRGRTVSAVSLGSEDYPKFNPLSKKGSSILSRFSDKWSLVVLYTLSTSDGPVRFNALQRKNPDISQKVLASTLRTLVEDGLVDRKVYPEVPPRVEYALTERSHTLLPHINSLTGWAKDNMIAILKDRKKNIGE